MSVSAEQIECRCAKCGGVAAQFSAWRAGEGTGFMADRDRLERTGWFGQVLKPLPLTDAETLLEAIRAGNLAALAKADPDLFGFFCRACGSVYCSACWDIGAAEFDDGFYDCTRGTCPQGHEQVVDD